MNALRVKALAFDVFGTVVDWRGSVISEFSELGRNMGLDVPWDAFVDEWKRCYRPGMDAVNAGVRPWTNVDGIYRPKLDSLLDKYEIRGLAEDQIRDLNRAWHRCNPWPDVLAGLNRLKKRYVLATLSNADMAGMVNMAKRGGLPWDCVLCAEIFRKYKPASEVYRGALDLIGFDPQEVMMVAAHNYDLKAARMHGMRTAFVVRPVEHGPAQTSDLEAEDEWDFTVSDFGELATVLNA